MLISETDKDTSYKMFIFGHTALGSIHHGIQGAHAAVEMFIKYDTQSPQRTNLYKWAIAHKTIILRNGGTSDNLRKILSILEESCPLVAAPLSYFKESNDYMDNILTSVAFVIPCDTSASTKFIGHDTDMLLDGIAYEKDSDGLSRNEVYGILNALIDSTSNAK
jgi:hypothetical protein